MAVGVVETAQAVRSGATKALDIVERAILELQRANASINAVTRFLQDRARSEASRVDAIVAKGGDPGPLAGVPYGVKDLFDVAGLPTTGGSRVHAMAEPAMRDAEAIERLTGAGAILVATLNMDEFAYGFATINDLHGTTRNPHDTQRLAGGSSGGSAAVVAAGLLAFSLGSDTNGSVRVPAALTGIFGLKPTHGDLPLTGVFPFAESFDDVGHFARSVADMAAVWEVLTGRSVDWSGELPRIARLGGRFAQNADLDMITAMAQIAPGAPEISLPDIARARSAAFLITAYEGGRLHRDALAQEAMAFDPQVRDRLLAGALLPDEVAQEAYAFREDFLARLEGLMADCDVMLAPATPCVAPPVDDPRIMIDGEMRSARSDLGIHTQPISFTGLPSMAVPLARPGQLPLGLQLIGRRGGEQALFRLAARLEQGGLIGAALPQTATSDAIEGALA